MKNVISFLSLALILFGLAYCKPQSQTARTEDEIKDEIGERAIREARQQAKDYERDGWEVPAGSLPMEKSLEKAWIKQYEENDEGQLRYITADGNAIAGNRNAAESQAIDMAKFQLAGLLETRVAGLVSQNVANTELSDQEAESISELVQNSKNIIVKRLGYVQPFFKMHRRLDNGNVEVSVKVFYDSENAMRIAREAVRDDLREKLDLNEEDLRNLVGLDEDE